MQRQGGKDDPIGGRVAGPGLWGCKYSAKAATGIVRGLPDDGVLKMNAFK
jgi:hypothetical protein